MDNRVHTHIHRQLLVTVVLVLVYILMGNARSMETNPFLPETLIAINMIVPVLGGILFGKKVGFLTGFLGTLGNAFSPAGTLFELYAVIPHALMGLAAGALRDRVPVIFASMALFVGHILDVGVFALAGLISTELLYEPALWYGVAAEGFVGMIAVTVFAALYRMAFLNHEHTTT